MTQLTLALALGQGARDPVDESKDLPRTLSLEADAWYASPTGWIYITRGSRAGTATKAREGDAFDLDSKVLATGKAWVRLWNSNALGFRIASTEESGTSFVEQDFIYHGNTYSAGRKLRAELGFLLLDLDYQVVWEAAEDLTVTPHLGAAYWGFSSRLRTVDALPLIDEKRGFSSGYWLTGVDVDARLSSAIHLYCSFLGGANGADRYFVEGEMGASLHLSRSFAMKLAYRFHEVRFHTSTNEADLAYHGPSVGLEFGF